MRTSAKFILGFFTGLCVHAQASSNFSVEKSSASISLKIPGNMAVEYGLHPSRTVASPNSFAMVPSTAIPVDVAQNVDQINGSQRITVTIKALEDVYFHYAQKIESGFTHDDCQFYMPGFWYRRNLRSPKEAPSFHTSDSWIVREDRLSTPLTGIFNERTGDYMTVARVDEFNREALTTHKDGEVILSGSTSIGYTGFENVGGNAVLSFGFPYHEAPKTYVRKLTLAPEVKAFQYLKKGEEVTFIWEVNKDRSAGFSDFVEKVWRYSYALYRPEVVKTPYTPEIMKEVLSNFFIESFVDKYELKYMSGVHMHTDKCESSGIAEIGFVGRILLNAFNALEYGEQQNRPELVANSRKVYDTYLKGGFTGAGFFKEVVDFDNGFEEKILSIRRQSEGLYAVLNYLQYEKKQGRRHPEWETKVRSMLDKFLALQRADGSFPRKFNDDMSVVDQSGGSTPSATPTLVLASVYFKDKRYLNSARKTAGYLDREIISKADYFSSTLDANCEDKEASYYASTALYYLSVFTKGDESARYAALCKKSAFFALSWYYVWDVPFAQGQMLGDVGLKTRGWGNVSVENNHIDVFIFEFGAVLDWLATEFNEPGLAQFADVIETSMCQLLPVEGHMCGIGKRGYYPEVVQHTNWDYGRNGKGFYNDIFAPGWTVASLWELLTPNRLELFTK
ncbi:MAG: hypothetical protein QM786_14420 [Breznakibacter sp.]